jgi:hypothetical protein
MQVLQSTSTEVVSFIRQVSQASVDHAARYLYAVVVEVKSDSRKRYSWKDFLGFISTPTPKQRPFIEGVRRQKTEKKTPEFPLVYQGEITINDVKLNVSIHSEVGRARVPTLIRAWDLATFHEYSMRIGIPDIVKLIQQSQTNEPADVAIRILPELRLERQIVATRVAGSPKKAQSKKVFAGAKYVCGRYAVVQAFEDGTMRLYVPKTGEWFEASTLGSQADLRSCFSRLVFSACKTGLVLALAQQ